jgi:class 3 adenylate cyclase/Tfp pilus assembly protein PilF
MDALSVYIPMDRRQALVYGDVLPDRTSGAAMFADISGFTLLAEALAQQLGPQRGAEELTNQLNRVFGALIAEVHRYGGCAIGFSGDAITCWLDGDQGLRGIACALALQRVMRQFVNVVTPFGATISLAVKVTVVTGSVRRFLVGDPQIQQIDVLAGRTLDTLAAGERLAERGDVLVDDQTADRLSEQVAVATWRVDVHTGRRFAVVADLADPVAPTPWPTLPPNAVDPAQARSWLLPSLFERLQHSPDQFLAGLRPVVALFLAFGGIDYDHDDDAGVLLNAFIRRVQHVVTRYEGALLAVTMGDKGSYLYATFGAPIAHDDDVARAVAAALELRDLPLSLHFCTEVRIGIARGQVYTGAYGSSARRTYGALGDKVNLAARLMQLAGPGEVFCDGETYRRARSRWMFEVLSPRPVKGKAGLVPVYQPTGQPAPDHSPPLVGDRRALVGRAAEVARLEATLDSLQAGKGRLLFIEGEAGIGKSRLVAELARLAQERGLRLLTGAGQSIEQQTPYRAWREVFNAYFTLGAGPAVESMADRSDRQARVCALVQEIAPHQLQRAPLLNDLLDLGLPDTPLTAALDPGLRQESLTGFLITLLRARAQQQPLVVVLDDAHWLDSLSWALAAQLARAMLASDTPLLLVLALRPLDDQSIGAQQVAALRATSDVDTLDLPTLDPDETVALVTSRLGLPDGSLPASLAALVSERAEGNPFFAEELIFTLLDQHLIAVERAERGAGGTPARCIVSGDLHSAGRALPDTVQGLILARIDRLPPDLQVTLKVAAVIGRTFALIPLLYTLNHYIVIVELALRAHLDELIRHNLTTLETWDRDLTYIFKHVITQEVAYQTLLFDQRRQLHRTVAEWYERTYGSSELRVLSSEFLEPSPQNSKLAPYLPLLVYHYHHAEDLERERHYARLAGEQATASFSNVEASAYFSRALELTPGEDIVGRYELLRAREQVENLRGARDEQARDLEALAALAEQLNSDARQAEVALRQAHYAEVIGDYPAASLAAQRVVMLAQAAGLPECVASGYLQWGRALYLQADYAAARAPLEQALALARASRLPSVEANSLRSLGLIALMQGDYTEARGYVEQAIRIFRAIDDRRGESAAHANLGAAASYQGDYVAAQADFEQALQLAREIGDRLGESDSLVNLGVMMREQGNYTEARTCYEQALRLAREILDRWGESGALNGLGNVVAAQGDYPSARAYQQQTLQLSREIGDRLGESFALVNLGEVSMALGDYAEARGSFDQALDLFRTAGDRRNESWALANLGLLRHNLGDNDAAQDLCREALRIAQEVGARSEQGRALTVIGHALLGLGRPAEAADAYHQALSLRRELGEHQLALDSHAGLARAALAQGDVAEACAHAEAILGQIETAFLDGTAEPLRVYLACYLALKACHDPRAQEVLARAYDLLQERAAGIGDDAQRRSFLENVPAHRALAAAWVEQAGPDV